MGELCGSAPPHPVSYPDFKKLRFLPRTKLSASISLLLYNFQRRFGATSEYPATHTLLKSTATVVRGLQSASKVIFMY